MPLATRKVTISVTTEDGKDNGPVSCIIEQDRGSGHVRLDAKDVTCNKGEMSFDLEPGQRLVVVGHAPDAVAYDHEQRAAFIKEQQTQTSEKNKIDDPNKNPPPKKEELKKPEPPKPPEAPVVPPKVEPLKIPSQENKPAEKK